MRTPNFPGGPKAMDLFVKEHMKYPEEAIRTKIAGSVVVLADIDYKGHVIKTIVKKGIGYGCDEEAARVVSLMQFEALRYRGLRVVFHKTITLHFKLPGATEINPEITYSYRVTNPEENKTYTYRIKQD